jgi:hypothetical protein
MTEQGSFLGFSQPIFHALATALSHKVRPLIPGGVLSIHKRKSFRVAHPHPSGLPEPSMPISTRA